MVERFIKRISKHTAVYWGSPTPRADGSNSYVTPIEIKCFWVDGTKLTSDKSGREVSVIASVYVTQDLSEQGMLFKGTLSSLTAPKQADPRKVSRAYEITKFQKIPSLYLNEYNRVALINPIRV